MLLVEGNHFAAWTRGSQRAKWKRENDKFRKLYTASLDLNFGVKAADWLVWTPDTAANRG